MIGFQAERKRLLEALDRNTSLLIVGPRGSGKTELAQSVIEEREGKIVYVNFMPRLHDLLLRIALILSDRRHPTLLADSSGPRTSVHLKGVLWRAFEEDPCTMVLDGIEAASPPVYRFLQRIYFTPGAAIVGLARARHSLGYLQRLFWDPREILEVKPLSERDSCELFDLTISSTPVPGVDLDDLRERILGSAGGNPGYIIEMCRMAANARYRSGSYVKFGLMRIDMAARLVT